MSDLRFRAVEKAFNKKAVNFEQPNQRPDQYFAVKVFDREKMKRYLPAKVYDSIIDVIDNGKHLDRNIADAVAEGMRIWASEHGVTHYTHWFQPLTGGTAEKHESFIEYNGKGGVMESFSGKVRVQQEPDASSFPNGGIRNTFEARGYTAWDASSPVFIIDDTLCIPTIFISYTGESLDYKAPLLRSLRAINKAAVDVCRFFDPEVKQVKAFLGIEQEYFLVDADLCIARPDLLTTGRTLIGLESAKNQQLDDHYFGSIPQRVISFMAELEIRALKLGIPLKTRHNEAAPGQFELAPIYEECNLAVDHNMLIMSLMQTVAAEHGFRVLLHEKPFRGINGSGKHCNWSLGTDKGSLLFAPGKNESENLRFLTFVVNTLKLLIFFAFISRNSSAPNKICIFRFLRSLQLRYTYSHRQVYLCDARGNCTSRQQGQKRPYNPLRGFHRKRYILCLGGSFFRHRFCPREYRERNIPFLPYPHSGALRSRKHPANI